MLHYKELFFQIDQMYHREHTTETVAYQYSFATALKVKEKCFTVTYVCTFIHHRESFPMSNTSQRYLVHDILTDNPRTGLTIAEERAKDLN